MEKTYKYVVTIRGKGLEEFTALELCELLRKELGEVEISVREEGLGCC